LILPITPKAKIHTTPNRLPKPVVVVVAVVVVKVVATAVAAVSLLQSGSQF